MKCCLDSVSYRIKGKWKQLIGRIKKQWGKLTDDDMTRMEGSREELLGKIQERYGITKEQAEKQIREFESQLD
ncbi:MAG: CsbD family protein [Nitrospirota bacterium]|nr:CsbD family protein [Nitrospirota bacterium]